MLNKKFSHNLKFVKSEELPNLVNETTTKIYDYFRRKLKGLPIKEDVWYIPLEKNYDMPRKLLNVEVLDDDGVPNMGYFFDFGATEAIFLYMMSFVRTLGITKDNIESLKEDIEKEIKITLVHELSHAIDPKVLLRSKKEKEERMKGIFREPSVSELGCEEEFDAYSQEICYKVSSVLKNTDDENLELSIFNWIKFGKLTYRIPDFLMGYLPIFEIWENNEIYKRRFLLRICHELSSEEKNIFAKIQDKYPGAGWSSKNHCGTGWYKISKRDLD